MSDTTRDHKSRLVVEFVSRCNGEYNGGNTTGRRKWTAFKSDAVRRKKEEEKEEQEKKEEESKNVYVYRIPFVPTMRLYALVYLFFGDGTYM